MGGSVILLVTVAVLFLRNQFRPIATLARVAEQFGMGQSEKIFAKVQQKYVRPDGLGHFL